MVKTKQLVRPRIGNFGFGINNDEVPYGSENNSKDATILLIIEWVILNIGPYESGRWKIRGFDPSFLRIYFDDEDDAAAFKLRWG